MNYLLQKDSGKNETFFFLSQFRAYGIRSSLVLRIEREGKEVVEMLKRRQPALGLKLRLCASRARSNNLGQLF